MPYLAAWAKEAVGEWLLVRDPGAGTTSLLLPIDKAGRIEDRWLGSQAVLDILQRVGESAGIEGFAPHNMLRTFITSLPDVGAELHVVSQFAGHGSVETTKFYDQRGEQAKMRAVERLELG